MFKFYCFFVWKIFSSNNILTKSTIASVAISPHVPFIEKLKLKIINFYSYKHEYLFHVWSYEGYYSESKMSLLMLISITSIESPLITNPWNYIYTKSPLITNPWNYIYTKSPLITNPWNYIYTESPSITNP